MKPLPLACASLIAGILLGAIGASRLRAPGPGGADPKGGRAPATAVAPGPAPAGGSAAAPASRGRALVMASDSEARGYEAAAKSAEAALASAREITNQRERAEFLRGIFLKLAEADPARALEMAGHLDEADRGQALLTLAYAWMPESASAPFGSLIRSHGLEAGLGFQFLKAEPPDVALAIQWAQALMAGPRTRGAVSLLGAAAREMARTDPKRAFELGKDLTGWEKDRFVADVAGGWAGVNPAAAAEWVAQFPPGSTRDRAYAALLKPWAEKDPAAAASAAMAIGERDARAEAIQSVAEQWTGRDEARARAWAASLADPAARSAAESGIWNAKPVGVGLTLRADRSGAVLIGGLLEGGPAARTGQIRANDRIVAVEQPGAGLVDVNGLKLDQVVTLLRGARGSAVTLRVTGDDGSPRTVRVVRDALNLK